MQKYSSKQWWELAVRRRRTVVQVAAVVMVAVSALTFLWPPTYRSSADILIQDNRAQLLVSPGRLTEGSPSQPEVVTGSVTEEDLNSQQELLTSDYLVEQALQGTPGPEDHGWVLLSEALDALFNLPSMIYGILHNSPDVTPLTSRVHKVLRHLSGDVLKRSDLIEISFTSHDPKWAQEFLERLIGKYLELHGSLSNDTRAEHFFQAQARLLEERLRGDEEQLKGYELQTGISNLAEQKQALITQISGFQGDAGKMAANLAAAQERTKILTAMTSRTPTRVSKEVKVVQDMALQTIKPQVLELETQRADLLSRYQPNSERIKEIDAKLAAAQQILNRENHLEVQERSTDLNPERTQLDSQLQQAEADAASLASSQEALKNQIDNANRRLNELVTDGVRVERLQRQVEADKEAYMSYLRRGEEARVAGAARAAGVPSLLFATGVSTHLGPIGRLGFDAVSVDWRIPLAEARRQLPHVALQGNLDSTLLLGPKATLLARARQCLEAVGHQPGYIFNLGHGLQPPTPPENVKALVDEVHAFRP
jgi:uncharacterized protein involved in exopolysaccharide biosynthesis